MPEIMSLAKEYKLIVVEDAAQALGVKIGDRMAGAYGDFGVFSFHSHKNITTLGEGGMIVVGDDNIAEIIPMVRHNGHCTFQENRSDYWIPAMGNVDLPELEGEIIWPNNFCLGEVECAVGAKLLDRIDSLNQRKRRRALAFIDALADKSELIFHRVDSERHNYHLLVAQVTGSNRDEFIRSMAYDEGIQCVVQYLPLNRYPFYQKAGMGYAECPNADRFFDNMVSFPFHDSLSDDDLKQIVASTRNVLDQLKIE
jgi:dTDP-4-amino-4,6-dideoxygalactose transaminase